MPGFEQGAVTGGIVAVALAAFKLVEHIALKRSANGQGLDQNGNRITHKDLLELIQKQSDCQRDILEYERKSVTLLEDIKDILADGRHP